MTVVKKSGGHRSERVASLIQTLLGPIVSERTSEYNALATISKIEVTSDLKHAKVWVSILGPNPNSILESLSKDLYNIQGELNRAIEIKVVPRIHFLLDTSPEYAQHIATLLEQTKNNE